MGHDCEYTDPDRRPAPKWGGASVGTVVDPFRGTVHVYESEPERAVLTVLISLPGVLSIREQRTVYHDLRGVQRPYTFDLIVEWVCGRREAVAVRQTVEGLHRDDTVEVIKAICAQHGARFADDYRAVTYETLDPVAVLNGREILRCGRDHDHTGKNAVRQALPRLGHITTLREIADTTALGQRGVRAAVALLQSGILGVPAGERLRLDLPLENRRSEATSKTSNHPL